MAVKIKNLNDLSKVMETRIKNALEITSIEVMNKLHDSINEQYYRDPEFYPDVYKRTYEFFNHVAYDMISSNTAQIYVDIEGMHYKNNFSPWQVVKWASESRHGADYYKTETTDFWTDFIDWCNNNLINLLKQNLKKCGVMVK